MCQRRVCRSCANDPKRPGVCPTCWKRIDQAA